MSSSKLGKAFTENHANIAQDYAEHLIAQSYLKIKILKKQKKEDEKLNAAKQLAKDLSEVYNSSIKEEKNKIDFFLKKIEEIESGQVNPDSSISYL